MLSDAARRIGSPRPVPSEPAWRASTAGDSLCVEGLAKGQLDLWGGLLGADDSGEPIRG